MKNKIVTESQPLLTMHDLERLLRLTRRTITRLCAAGKFPPPLKVGRSNRWRMEDIASLERATGNARPGRQSGPKPASRTSGHGACRKTSNQKGQ